MTVLTPESGAIFIWSEGVTVRNPAGVYVFLMEENMNRNDRKHLRESVDSFRRTFMHAESEFTNVIEDFKADEEEKLDNLPDGLQESQLADRIQESIDQLEDISEQLETIEDACEDLFDLTKNLEEI